MGQRAVVIGAGVGGLAAALRLAARGIDVTLIEKKERVGGRLNLWIVEHPARPAQRPFRFEMGPTRLTLPLVFMDLFAAADEDVRNHLQVIKLDPIARYLWPDGSTLDWRAGASELAEQIGQRWPEDVPGWRRLYQRGRRIWASSEAILGHAPGQLLSAHDSLAAKLMAGLRMLSLPLRAGAFGRYARAVDRQIRSRRLREVLYQYPARAGVSPWRAPATLLMLPFIEHHFGSWSIRGGMYRLAERLELVAGKLGVRIRTSAEVEQILIEPDGEMMAAAGVRLRGGEEIRADAVVASSGPGGALSLLIPERYRPLHEEAAPHAPPPLGSEVTLMLGVEGTYPQLSAQTRLMPVDYSAELQAIFQARTLPADPCLRVEIASRIEPSAVPDGCEALIVRASAPSPHGSTIDWGAEGQRYRDRIIRMLEMRGGLANLSRRIIVERMLTPADGPSPHKGCVRHHRAEWRRALFRPAVRDPRFRRLYVAAGWSGGCLALEALAGKVAAELVMEDLHRLPG